MKIRLESSDLELIRGDITQQDTEAIVNAANSRLAGGGGVDGAIHRAGGPLIMKETRRQYPNGCSTGDAVITGAGRLKARYVVHAVGPIWRGGRRGEPEQLSNAYRRSLEVATQQECDSISFPSLSTGAYRYPVDLAAATALKTVVRFLKRHRKPKLLRFVLFDRQNYRAYESALKQITAAATSEESEET